MNLFTTIILLTTCSLQVLGQTSTYSRPKESEVTTTFWFPSTQTFTPSPLLAKVFTTEQKSAALVTNVVLEYSGPHASGTASTNSDNWWDQMTLDYQRESILTMEARRDQTFTTTLESGTFNGSRVLVTMTATCESLSGVSSAACSGNRTTSTELWSSRPGDLTTITPQAATITRFPTKVAVNQLTVTVTHGNVWPTTSSQGMTPPRATGVLRAGAAAAFVAGGAVLLM